MKVRAQAINQSLNISLADALAVKALGPYRFITKFAAKGVGVEGHNQNISYVIQSSMYRKRNNHTKNGSNSFLVNHGANCLGQLSPMRLMAVISLSFSLGFAMA